MDTTVYMYDQQNNPNNKREYTAEVYVDVDGTVKGPYRGSTYPNYPDTQSGEQNTVDSGTYDYNNASGHNNGTQKGLNIVNDRNSTTQENRKGIPGTRPSGESVSMDFVNVHSGVPSANDPAGLGRQNRGSAGCPTIHPSDADAFFSNFDWSGTKGTTGNSTGTITIYRGTSVSSTVSKTYLKVKQWIQKTFEG